MCANSVNTPGQVYLVGGAVRDKLLGLPHKERDWVVVGSNALEMERAGFMQVGKNFPVFLHPKTHEEYALARTEKKTAPGYHGFSFSTQNIALEDDLKRRDLTINSMAISSNGNLIDPYGGLDDLNNRILRHTSLAFTEDPVRVLRAARFASQLSAFNFHIADTTMTMMEQMIESGELSALIRERVWLEIKKACSTDAPSHFFVALNQIGAWNIITPKTYRLENLFHSETFLSSRLGTASRHLGATGVFGVLAFSAAVLDINLNPMCKSLNAPSEYRKISQITYRVLRKLISNFNESRFLSPANVLEILHLGDALRNPTRFRKLLLAWRFASFATVDNALKTKTLAQLNVSIKQLLAFDASTVTAGLKGVEAGEALKKAHLSILFRQTPPAKIRPTKE